MTAQPPESFPRPAPSGGLRASHDDREAVVELLRDAAAEGRIDFGELDSRLEQALTAKTHAELSALTADLPKPSSAGSLPPLLLKGGMNDETTPDRLPGTPLIRLAGTGGVGGVVIRHPNRREQRKLRSNPTQG
ncbi:DUF1707 domain-containing protein [Streptomyces sp. NPDC127106]|uniref:DUF1707 SHOCT-like domain-containing protein n=1 Tax=Streptomyces sp. NPDC127106 TaxID=3345360 RepID=UPI0036265CD0